MSTQEYTIKIVPDDGGSTRTIRLSSGLLKYGIASFGLGAVLLAGAFGYAAYSSYTVQSKDSQVSELQQVNNIQQEQLLQLSKKANSLQDQLDQLGQQEMELRQMSGISGGESVDNTNVNAGVHDGQGGPLPEDPTMDNVRDFLAGMEKKVTLRTNSVRELQTEMKKMPLVAVGGFSGLAGVSVPSIWPAQGEVSSPYGLRWNGSDFHPGIDIANDFGTPIVATADGVVMDAGWNAGGYGNMVDIDHGNGYTTLYGHAQQVVVVPGQHVSRGQVIAYMGSTGYSTGPHVHYEVSLNGQRINPVGFL